MADGECHPKRSNRLTAMQAAASIAMYASFGYDE